MSPKGILTLKIYGAMIGIIILGEWIKAPETILPTIAFPFAIYFGYHLLKACWEGMGNLFGAVFFKEQRAREAEERLRQEKERFEKLEAERKEAERLERVRAEERRLLSTPDQIAGLFTYKYIKIYDRLGVEIVLYNGFDERSVTIPDTIANYPVIRIGKKAFANAKMQSVSCPDSVIEIGENAFKSCTKLKKIKLSASLKKIGEYAFAYCEKLESVILPEGLEKMDMCAFAYSGICEIHFPSTLKEIPYACCCDCVNLTYVQIKYGVKRIGGKAFGCGFRKTNKIQSIVIPESVDIVGNNAFDGSCAAIAFRGMHTNGEEAGQYSIGKGTHSIGGGVYYVLPGSAMQRFAREHMHECRSLSEFDQIARKEERHKPENKASDIDKSQIELVPEKTDRVKATKPALLAVGKLFSYQPCSIDGKHGVEITAYNGLDEHRISIPENLEGHTVIRIADKAFESLDVDQVWFPRSLIEIGSYAFSGCKKLQALTIPRTVKRIESNAFANCEQLEKIVLPDGIEQLGEFVFAYTGITKIVFPASLEEIPVGCCQNCMKLTEVTLNNGIQRIKAKAFAQPVLYRGSKVGNKLSSLLIPESVELIETDAFLNRKGIQLAFLGMKTTALEEKRMPYEHLSQRNAVFYGKEDSEIQAYAKKYCARYHDLSEYRGHGVDLIKKQLPVIASPVKQMNASPTKESNGKLSFRECKIGDQVGLEITSYARSAGQREIVIPEHVNNQPVLKLGKNLFEYSELERIVCPESLLVIDNMAFAHSAKLREVNIPKSVIEIGEKAFMASGGLGQVVLPESLKKLGAYAFARSGIEGIVFNSELKIIPEACCLNCFRLKDVMLAEGVKQIKNHAFAINDLEAGETNRITGIMIPESVKMVDHNAFRGRERTSIAFSGMQTNAEENMASPFAILYVRPGSVIQRYGRRNGLKMKPFDEYKGSDTIQRPQNEVSPSSIGNGEKDAITLEKSEYIRQAAAVLKQYIHEQNNLKDDALLGWKSTDCDAGYPYPGSTTNTQERSRTASARDSSSYYSFYTDHKVMNEEKYEWRDHVEDGWEFGVDPEDYETEEEYMEALNEEKYSWRDMCVDNNHGIDPEEYETEEEYETAVEEADDGEW